MEAHTFAHLTDPHLPMPPEGPRFRELLSKRLLSYRSWQRKRRHFHTPAVLAALLADVAAHAPDHIAVTGDIGNISIPGEYTAGRAWLQGLGDPARVSYIPGNHDALVAVPWKDGLGLWRDWMAGDDAAPLLQGDDLFPAVRIRGPVAYVGVNSGLPTAPLLATGSLGMGQLERLERVLADLGGRGLFRVLLLHHPAVAGVVGRRKGLTDRAALHAVLKKTGAEMLLHGHSHYAHWGMVPGPLGSIPSITLPSASAFRPHKRYNAARWQLVGITREAGGWRAAITMRGWNGLGFETIGRYDLLLPAMAPVLADAAA